jgi:hypothetical protein
MNRKNNTLVLQNAQTATNTGTSYELWGTKWAFQAYGSTSAGSGSATILIQVSNVDTDAAYITMGTITLTLGTTVTADGFASDAPWKFVRAKVSAISGTNASVNVVISNNGV